MIYLFGDYELDTQLFELRVGGKPCHLEPQVFNLLAFLVLHRDRVVTKDELLEAVWGTQFITEATLSSRLMAARKALGDDGQAQRFIKTLRGRGFRFVHEVTEREPHSSAPSEPQSSVAMPDNRALEAQPLFLQPAPAAQVVPVGRETEFGHLHRHFEKARNGTRQVVFVTGEAGVGKTTLVSSFVDSLQKGENARIACGQCLEQHGASEAYMPLLDAFARLCRSSDGAAVIEVLRKCAPTWLVQMPWLLSAPDMEALEMAVRGATRERMLREMVQTLESLAESRPLVLVLEDLHWSDFPTLDLLSWLARRTESARLLILGTYRPADITLNHPLRTTVQELRIRGHGVELAMPFLDETAVQEYLAARFAGASFPTEVAQILRERTGGNPLFMRNVVDTWVAHNLLLETALLHKGVADTVCMIVLSYEQQDSATLAKVSAP
jgi:DNA-binding winged helix-turn-helix (wHTH) protein